MSNFAGLVWKANFGHLFGNIWGLNTYFQNQFFSYKGVRSILSAYFRVIHEKDYEKDLKYKNNLKYERQPYI